MSLINQVLNDLEKRGENAPLGEATIRAVPPREQSQWMNYVIFAAGLLILLVMASRYSGRDEEVRTTSVVAIASSGYEIVPALTIAPSLAVSMPVSASSVETSGVVVVLESVPIASSAGLEADTPPKFLRNKPVIAAEKSRKPTAAPIKNTLAQPKEEPSQNKPAAKPAEDVPLKQISPRQQAESEFSKANLAAQEKRIGEALAGYETALHSDTTFKPARLSWIGLLLNLKRNEEAERVLQEGLKLNPHDTSFPMLLARLQVERGEELLALDTLQKNLPDAKDQADYQAFMAALMQRQNRHQEAISFFQAALQLVPNNGVWLMGMGISLQAMQRNEEAKEAYARALASNSLNAQLQAFVQKKLKEL
jgi:MSHA biogenesis protein MshN